MPLSSGVKENWHEFIKYIQTSYQDAGNFPYRLKVDGVVVNWKLLPGQVVPLSKKNLQILVNKTSFK